jgi:hypothetical protein
MSEPVTVRCTIIEERELALCVEQSQAGQAGSGAFRISVWLPRSQLYHISRREEAMNSEIAMPQWLAVAKGLDCE